MVPFIWCHLGYGIGHCRLWLMELGGGEQETLDARAIDTIGARAAEIFSRGDGVLDIRPRVKDDIPSRPPGRGRVEAVEARS